MFDLVIKNALIYDGSGKPPVFGHVGIKDGIIRTVSQTPLGDGKEVVDAEGLALSPGFIDH